MSLFEVGGIYHTDCRWVGCADLEATMQFIEYCRWAETSSAISTLSDLVWLKDHNGVVVLPTNSNFMVTQQSGNYWLLVGDVILWVYARKPEQFVVQYVSRITSA